jgi:hypothetical protein
LFFIIIIIIIIMYKVHLKMNKPFEKCRQRCANHVWSNGMCYKHANVLCQKLNNDASLLNKEITHLRSLIIELINASSSEKNPVLKENQLRNIEKLQNQLDLALSSIPTIIQPKKEPKDDNHYWYHTSDPFHRGKTNSTPSELATLRALYKDVLDISTARALYREVLDASCDSPDVIYGLDELLKLDTIPYLPVYIPRQPTKLNKERLYKKKHYKTKN